MSYEVCIDAVLASVANDEKKLCFLYADMLERHGHKLDPKGQEYEKGNLSQAQAGDFSCDTIANRIRRLARNLKE